MHFVYITLISITNNLDNIGVRIAYSIRGIKITTMKNLWISVITFILSALSVFSGIFISGYFSKHVSSIISMVLLTAIGVWIIAEPYINERKISSSSKFKPDEGEGISPADNEEKLDAMGFREKDKSICGILKKPENADLDNSKDIDFKEATLLGIALSINNIGGGISAGMIGLNPFFMGFMSALISFLALWSGNYMTEIINRLNLGKKATIIAGVLMILIGIKQLI